MSSAAPDLGPPIGVISDTHGLLRDEALAALEGCTQIVHVGDVGDLSIIARLEEIAPVIVVRGNVDTGPGLGDLPETAVLEVDGRCLYVIHIITELDLDLRAAGMDGVIFGHSHRPANEVIDGLLHLNPGSAGPRRFDLPVTLAHLWRTGDGWHAERIDLPVRD